MIYCAAFADVPDAQDVNKVASNPQKLTVRISQLLHNENLGKRFRSKPLTHIVVSNMTLIVRSRVAGSSRST